MLATRHPLDRAFVLEPLEQRQLLAAAVLDLPDDQHLTKKDVTEILAAAASQALPTQIITVVDRDGQVLGVVAMKDAKVKSIPVDNFGNTDPLLSTAVKSLTRARTGAFFESHEDAFTTRTARFIIQDHFPQPLPNTGGGPLYGVEFSNLPGSDVYSGPAISGDPGSIPLFKDGVPVGGIGVAGDGSDRLVREGLPYDPNTLPDKTKSPDASVNLYDGSEESDVDEQVALSGAAGFMAPDKIQATHIFVAGLRFPFTADQAAAGNADRTLDQITSSGDGSLVLLGKKTIGINPINDKIYSPQTSADPRSSPGSPYPAATFGGITGELKNTNTSDSTTNQFGFQSGSSRKGQFLSVKDVKKVITQAVQQALKTRAGIRVPIGVPVRVHVAVTDTTGKILGVFRMQDGTNFSFDVAVQKARTAAFFSDDTHAFSARAVGFVSQGFFPVGIDGGAPGQLFHIQNQLSLGPYTTGNTDFGFGNRAAITKTGAPNPLQNGITIFPGGAPLYENGVLVGAVGVSGDGVDQDDITTFAGTKNFQAPAPIRSDHLSATKIVNFLTNKVNQLNSFYSLDDTVVQDSLERLQQGLESVQLPYQKFPRNPEL